ncbi:phosphoglycerate mutase family [Achlya hypogyna]|uniref:Phosphoglycerate mutase family n=1 Tax=Achlya hypogyna TaxID=1202772 RepID=A0A1V9Z556_ACHHY|nr:phosphoglycerate mutase family [Achlya hypogyna]
MIEDRVAYKTLPHLFSHEAAYSGGVFDHFERETPSWAALTQLPELLQPNVKVLYWVRHAEGHHNAAERFYGTEEWDASISLLDDYLDASLNDAGLQDAIHRAALMRRERQLGLPLDKILVSPLTRTLQTAHAIFQLNTTNIPIVAMEAARETLGVHTCDKRSKKSKLVKAFPKVDWNWIAEEDDKLWAPTHRETDAEIQARCQSFLDDVFDRVPDKYVAIVSHAGFIQNCMRLLQYPDYKPRNCETIPMVLQRTIMSESLITKQLPSADHMVDVSSILVLLVCLVFSCKAVSLRWIIPASWRS